MIAGGVPLSATARLRILNALPQRHQDYFFEKVRTLCTKYIASLHMPMAERQEEALELFSEIMAKLLGVSGRERAYDNEETSDSQIGLTWPISDDPKRDGRVIWLIEQVGGAHALMHRHEDIRRRRHGGKWTSSGYRQVQLGPEHIDTLSSNPDDPHHDDDMRLVWRGMLAMAETEFETEADVTLLLHLMAHDSDIQAGFGAEWPITQMVVALNQRHPNPSWDDDRVENAKKRLKRWIARLKNNGGHGTDDLMELFARYARRQGPKMASLRGAHSKSPLSATASSDIRP